MSLLVEMHHEDERGNVYTLKDEISIIWAVPALQVTVPEGFESDGASVPRFLWSTVFPPGDVHALRAAFVHDYIYRTHPQGWTKELADALFYDLLIEGGVSKWRALKAYWGVKLFGRKSWESNRR